MKSSTKLTSSVQFAIILVCGSCLAQRDQDRIAGNYIQYSQPNTGNEVLALYRDNTFIYTVIFDVGGTFKFNGNWTLVGKKIVLKQTKNSEQRGKSIFIENVASSKGKKIQIINKADSTSFIGAEVSFDDQLSNFALTDRDGYVQLADSHLQKIRVKIFDTTDTTFTIKNVSSNDFKAYMYINPPKDLITEIPTKEWYLKGKRLLDAETRGKKNMLTKTK